MTARRLALVLVLSAACGTHAGAQRASRFTFETLTDVEGWKTDDSSRLVSRDSGAFALELRLRGWLAWRPIARLEFRAIGLAYAGRAELEHRDAYVELASVRYTPTAKLMVEGGKVLMPIGIFGPRRFSNTNPLIGEPDMYPTQYPRGVIASGAIGALDYRGGLVSLPVVNPKYSPAPEHRFRGIGGLGVRLGPSFHAGADYTKGPYLGDGVSSQLPAGHVWDEYQQWIFATHARYSIGHLEARGELAWSSYDAPTAAKPLRGRGWYGEARATLTPRVFVAARYENFAYPFILPVNPFFWVASVTTQNNAEAGLGYRFTPDALVKASLRMDHWPVHQQGDIAFPDGYAIAVQFSWHADVLGALDRKY